MKKDIDDIDLEIWKTVVSVQMHFNDLELRIRNFAILALGAILTVAGYSLRAENFVEVFEIRVPFASIALIIGAIIWLCFWYMDRHWYHRLLLGSVYHGIKIEDMYRETRPNLGLSETIKENSPYAFCGRKIRSQHRLNFFYWVIAVVLLIVSFAMFSIPLAALVATFSILMGLVIFFFTTEGVEEKAGDPSASAIEDC